MPTLVRISEVETYVRFFLLAAMVVILVLMIIALSGLGGKDRTRDPRPHLPADDVPDHHDNGR